MTNNPFSTAPTVNTRGRATAVPGDGGRRQLPENEWRLPGPAEAFLQLLLRLQLLTREAAARFFAEQQADLEQFQNAKALGKALVQGKLLTQYQLDRVWAGTTHGLVMGPYRVLERLGAGAFGVVHLAEHTWLGGPCALKVVPVDESYQDPQVIDRFRTEMKVLSKLSHPNVVRSLDCGLLPPQSSTEPGYLYLGMEWIACGDLEQRVANEGPIDVQRACTWIRQAALGLQHAHDLQLVHRDVKPSNIFLTDSGVAKVGDFGLVRELGSNLTDPGGLLGTIQYVAPEQAGDPTMVSSRSDIYSLGATLFFLLTGEPPHPEARSVKVSLEQLRDKVPRSVRELQPDVPQELDALINRMLNRDPFRRPSLAVTVARALAPFCR